MDPLDLWLQRGLQNLYSPVTAEPISRELMRLLEDDQRRSERRRWEPPQPQELRAGLSEEGGFEGRVRERAYFLWLEEGSPEGRALEHWMLAFTQQVAQDAYEQHIE
jgi:hypothetical protein